MNGVKRKNNPVFFHSFICVLKINNNGEKNERMKNAEKKLKTKRIAHRAHTHNVQSVIGASETLEKQTITYINTSYNQIIDDFFCSFCLLHS